MFLSELSPASLLPVGQIILHNGHQLGHLAEQQHPMIGGFQFGQNPVQKLEFAGSPINIRTAHHAAPNEQCRANANDAP